MANRFLETFELEIVARIEERISRNEAREVGLLVRWLGDFLSVRGKDLVTAGHDDLLDFCEERSLTRIDASMVRLISSLKALFKILRDTGLRSDDPASELKRPSLSTATISYGVDDGVLERVTKPTAPSCPETDRQEFSRKRFLAIMRLASEAGATCPEIAAIDLIGPHEDLILARGGRRERKARISADGRRDFDEFCENRIRFIATPSNPLFTSTNAPWARLDGKTIANIVDRAIRLVGLSPGELTPGMIHRSVPGAIVAQGLGWDKAAASAAYSKIPNVQREKTDLETMKKSIECFDRFMNAK